MQKIKPLIYLLMLCVCFPVWSGERTILVLGDSLSAAHGIDLEAGWVNLLRQRLSVRDPAWRVVNASVSGDTSAGGLARLPELLKREQPAIVIVELGSNDGLRGLSFKQLRHNLVSLIDAVEHSGARVLLIGGRLPPNYGTAYTEAFYRLFQEVAGERSLPLVPFLLAGVAEDRSLMQADGYHPLARAQPRVLDNVWPKLEAMLQPAEP